MFGLFEKVKLKCTGPSTDDFVYPSGYTVIQNGYGLFQAWKDGQVIKPCDCELLPDYQQNHDFMFVKSLRKAQELIVRHLHTQRCRVPVRTFGN